jgi:tRNA (adenine57-N1/adenine58-N1)-methyltransferase
MPAGRVYTHEVRADFYQIARDNLDRLGLLPFVAMHLGDIEAGFQAQEVDALFLDLREPWRYLSQVRAALRQGGFFACLLPTANQVIALLHGLDRHHFADVSVEELILRPYKVAPDRFRPDDALGHTGYLIFARCIDPGENLARWQRPERQRYEARLRAQIELKEQDSEQKERYPQLPLPD